MYAIIFSVCQFRMIGDSYTEEAPIRGGRSSGPTLSRLRAWPWEPEQAPLRQIMFQAQSMLMMRIVAEDQPGAEDASPTALNHLTMSQSPSLRRTGGGMTIEDPEGVARLLAILPTFITTLPWATLSSPLPQIPSPLSISPPLPVYHILPILYHTLPFITSPPTGLDASIIRYTTTLAPYQFHTSLTTIATTLLTRFHRGGHTEDRQEVLRADYGFVATIDREIRHDPEREDRMTGLYEVSTLRQSQRQLLAGRLNMLFRDRRAHARTARLMETEARMSLSSYFPYLIDFLFLT
ncbi:hypothetical protein Tco_1255988 [Tanacetum coccineum]